MSLLVLKCRVCPRTFFYSPSRSLVKILLLHTLDTHCFSQNLQPQKPEMRRVKIDILCLDSKCSSTMLWGRNIWRHRSVFTGLHAASLVAKSHPALCDPVDCSPQTPLVHEISQARILEWITISSSRGPSRARDRTRISRISCFGRRILYHWAIWEAHLLDWFHLS